MSHGGADYDLSSMPLLRSPLSIGRRTALLSAATVAWSCARPRISSVAPAAAVCLLTPEQVEGPYYLDDARVRRDLREGKPGVPLLLALKVLDARTCEPLEGAAVDLWHCDPGGLYSGFTAESARSPVPGGPPPGGSRPGGPPPPFGGSRYGDGPPPRPHRGDALTFLRGIQLTDRSGGVTFETLYPGWYPGRAVHIHVRVRVEGAVAGDTYGGGHVAHVGQLYLPEAETDRVFAVPPYDAHVGRRMLQPEDIIFRNGGAAGLAALDGAAHVLAGYRGALTMAVDPAVTPAPVGIGERPPAM